MSTKSGLVVGILLGLILSSFLPSVQPIDSQLESTNLMNEYNALIISYNNKVDECNQAYSNWENLSQCVYEFYHKIKGYVDYEDAIPRLINKCELEKISATIIEVSKKAEDKWEGYWNIHKYVRDEIKYAYDPEIPIIKTYRYQTNVTGLRILNFETETTQDHHQALEYTVEYKQGDCDDQAILEYAMIQYYRKYIHGTPYTLYLASLSFNDGGGHAAVFMPVVEGNLCILDPAGQYQTGTRDSIQSNEASSELLAYNDHWIENGGIKEITLWTIDIDTGTYIEKFKGSLADALSYLSD